MEEANIFAVQPPPPPLPASKERECHHHFPLTLFSLCIAGTFSPELATLERGWAVVDPNKTTAEKCGILLPIYCSTS